MKSSHPTKSIALVFPVFSQKDIAVHPFGSRGVLIVRRITAASSLRRIAELSSHFVQLAAHRIPLKQRREERQYSYSGDYSGANDQMSSDRREVPSFPYERVFLGICVIGLGGTCLWFSFESFEKISKSPRYMAGGVILGLIAIALIGHGLFYACLGVWGLPSLYVL